MGIIGDKPVIQLGEFEESFVIHFAGDFHRINAYTLASTLVSFADAAKTANQLLNPGYEIEIVVEALGTGSFQAKIRAIYNSSGNLFSADSVKNLVLSVIASYIFVGLHPEQRVNVVVTNDQVIIEEKDRTIIIPRSVHDALRIVEKSDKFKEGIGSAFNAVQRDSDIQALEISNRMDDRVPSISVPRSRFEEFAIMNTVSDGETREITEAADLQVVRAIFEPGKRKWEFVWRGVRIAAPVSDNSFFQQFSGRQVSLAPGDVLRSTLKIRQHYDASILVWLNVGYEVVEVKEHIAGVMQRALLK